MGLPWTRRGTDCNHTSALEKHSALPHYHGWYLARVDTGWCENLSCRCLVSKRRLVSDTLHVGPWARARALSRRIFFAFSGLSLVQGTCHHVDMGNQEEQGGTEEGEFSPLGLALLKQFAAGFSATCLFITYTFRLFLLVFTRKKMFFHARNMCKHSRLAKLKSRCVRLSSCHISEEQFWEERPPWPKAAKSCCNGRWQWPIQISPTSASWRWSADMLPSTWSLCSPACLLPVFQGLRCCWYLSQRQLSRSWQGHHAPYLKGTGLGLQAHIWRLKQGTRCSWFKKKDWAANAVRVDDDNCFVSNTCCASLLVL